MIHHGDLFDILDPVVGLIPDSSIDACVTDPPYGIGFMGKEWDTFKPDVAKGVSSRQVKDHSASTNPNLKGRKEWAGSAPVEYDFSRKGLLGFQAWTGNWASHVYRVLKPGAYLLVSGSPRTFHRMACGLEDAGFVVKDCLIWGQGQGFPKSLKVSENARFCQCVKRNVHSVREEVSCSPAPTSKSEGDHLLQALQRKEPISSPGQVLGEHEGEEAERSTLGGSESGVEGRGDVISEARELQTDQVRSLSGSVPCDGAEGRLRDGTSPDHGDVDGTPAPARRSRSSRGSRSAAQRQEESGTVAGQPESQTPRTWSVCGRCGKPVVPSGVGTALKPAWEPIVVAQKPFKGSIASCYERYGTGAMNIDACRLDVEGDAIGRWPPNVAIDDIVAEMLDEQIGDLVSGANPERRGSEKFRNAYGEFKGQETCFAARGAESGGPSRFFYCAKPSREERDMGCEGLVQKQRDESRKAGNPGGDNPRNRGLQLRGNYHPTVKPVELMRWLVRLVTPPRGTVLDCFAGSGTTGMACRLEMREFIGIEREAEFVEIANRRIAATAPLLGEMLESATDTDDGVGRQDVLFSDE